MEFEALLNNEDIDFSRYNYFFVKYLDRIGKRNKAKTTLNNSLGKFPRNLLLNQHKLDRKNSKISSRFNCEKVEDVVAEILYITANALSSQSIYSLSNFYLNLAKYLNKNFHAFDTLLAENFYNINMNILYERIKKIWPELQDKLLIKGASK